MATERNNFGSGDFDIPRELRSDDFERQWPLLKDGRLELMSVSENAVYLATLPNGRRYVLRINRPGNHENVAITSELAWLSGLQEESHLRVPVPVPGLDGQLLQKVDFKKLGSASPTALQAALFDYLPGRPITIQDDLSTVFLELGAMAGSLHRHAINWERSLWFQRPLWTDGAILDDQTWGDWCTAPGVGGDQKQVILVAVALLRRKLLAYGTNADRFGLIHADMRLGNLLLDGNELRLIDFDDSGFGWFMYDFAAAISFYELDARVPEWRLQWLSSYAALRTPNAADIVVMDSMVLLRRVALLAWIGSHSETELAQSFANGFADGTALLAERYLVGDGQIY